MEKHLSSLHILGRYTEYTFDVGGSTLRAASTFLVLSQNRKWLCVLSPLLFMIFMDELLRCSQVLRSVHLQITGMLPLHPHNDLLAQSRHPTLEHFAADSEAAGMKNITSKSNFIVLSQKRLGCSFQLREKTLLPSGKVFCDLAHKRSYSPQQCYSHCTGLWWWIRQSSQFTSQSMFLSSHMVTGKWEVTERIRSLVLSSKNLTSTKVL